MSNDTKRALEIILPMAQECGIKVSADARFLYCDNTAIGIACNSTWATIMEFVGYVFHNVWARTKNVKIPAALSNRIKWYWYNRKQVEQIKAGEGSK